MDLYRARKDIVEFLYTLSANDYPAICKQLGLSDGTIKEAFNGKRNFMYNRLIPLSEKEILSILKKIKLNYNVDLIPEEKYSYKLSGVTRRDIINALLNGFEVPDFLVERKSKISWHGIIGELDFLKRIIDLKNIELVDTRCSNFEEEYYRHRVYNDDYEPDYLFNDERFGIKNGNDSLFLNVICEVIHPEVRDENSDWRTFKNIVNELINNDGFEIYEKGKISGRPLYSWKKITYFENYTAPSTNQIENRFDSKYIKQQIEVMEKNISINPTLAIGKAKELLETCYKYIGNKRNVEITKNDNLMQMDKKIRHILNLDKDSENNVIPGFTLLCSGLANIVHGVSELRNSYGDGHGKDAKTFKPLNQSYSRLIVYTCINYVQFLLDIDENN